MSLVVNFITEDPFIVQFIDEEPINVEFKTNGPPGESAYQIAVRLGFVGTEAEWIASLQSDIIKSPTAPLSPVLNQLWIET